MSEQEIREIIEREQQSPEVKLLYPGNRTEEIYLKALHEPKKVDCILCSGQGMLPDAKTGRIRTCLCCDGSGKQVSIYKKYSRYNPRKI